ncbi:hypothetical protein [Neptunitalea chrysea]|nr:hypothetical protein [Neptunitalea chrysea]
MLLLASLAYNLHQNQQNEDLNASLEVYNKQAEITKKKNLKTIDSLHDISLRLDSLVVIKEDANAELQIRIQHYLAKDTADEEALNGITNTDSIRSLFARYYSNNHLAGKAGH